MRMGMKAAALAVVMMAFGQANAQGAPVSTTSTTVSAKLAQTPPMGWNSWNKFAKAVTQKDVMDSADALVASGMRDAGYVYVNIDDTWEGERDAQGVLHANAKFPDMKALGEYLHARGLKFGIYSGPGETTCGKYVGSLGHEQQDADLYASWGVDYLKYDLCSFRKVMDQARAQGGEAAANRAMREAYGKMRKALDATGRPMVFSLCQYGWDHPWTWAATEVGGNLWRTTGDISDDWFRMSDIGFSQVGLAKYAGPGHWNDPDMLEVGNGGMKHEEYVTHMSLWAILAAPLLAGNDLSKMTDDTKAILMNKAVIAIDQDALGKQGDRFSAEGPFEIWTRPLSGGAMAVGLFNRDGNPDSMTVSLSEIGMKNASSIVNVWTGEAVKAKDGKVTFLVPRHGAVLLRVAK